MKFSKRVNYLLLLFLFVLNIAVRYPTIQHELGADSFLIHILSNSITQYHYGKWILHPLSYIGLYPLSYPSAYPYLAAGVSVSTGVNVEGSIFLISIILGLIGVFGIYFLAKEIMKDDVFCFVVALAFTLSPLFIRMTFWQASTRNLFISLAPACILLLLKTRGFAINRLNFLFIFLLLTVGTSHRLGVFMIIILIAYLASIIIFAIFKQLVPVMAKSNKARGSLRFVGPLVIMGIFGVLLSMLLAGDNPLEGAKGLEVYEETSVLTGSSPPILIINLFINLIGRIGFMLIFGLIGLGLLIWKKNKGLYDIFVIVSLIFIFPTIGMRTYYSYFFLIFFSLLTGLTFYYIFRIVKKRKIIALGILVFALVASYGFYDFMFDHWKMEANTMSETTWDSAMYVRYKTNGTFISNDGLTNVRVAAISGKPCFPIGGSTLLRNGPEQLIYGYLHEEDYQVIPIPVETITVSSDALFKAKGAGNVEFDWATMHQVHVNGVSPSKILKYNLQYSLANKRWGNGNYAFGTTYYSGFLASLRDERYKIYDNGAIEIHYFEHP